MRLCLAGLALCGSALAFSTRSFSSSTARRRSSLYADTQQDAFAAFADSLEEKEDVAVVEKEVDDESWQERLEMLLDPLTPLAQRQVLMSELMASNEDIRNSVKAALRDRKIDPLLTPTGKKLQDGTRAVARQLTTDILPTLAEAGPPKPPDLSSVNKIGSRILNAISNQATKAIQDLEQDIRDPSRIPQRITQQTQDLRKEAKNVFLETPEGLVGPEYTVLSKGKDYEIREYAAYTVASTNMGEGRKMTDIPSSGAAFNALAAYLFGANEEGRAMTMTTPVTTTSLGEMRFYLSDTNTPPAPLEDGKSGMYEAGAVQIMDIPAARLAVKRFTGFVTEGEVARQKDALLSELEMDGIEIDVPHGAVVPYVIFQYNPPYTIPMVRRNEIAVPVREAQAAKDLETEWGAQEDDGDLSPSDVE